MERSGALSIFPAATYSNDLQYLTKLWPSYTKPQHSFNDTCSFLPTSASPIAHSAFLPRCQKLTSLTISPLKQIYQSLQETTEIQRAQQAQKQLTPTSRCASQQRAKRFKRKEATLLNIPTQQNRYHTIQ